LSFRKTALDLPVILFALAYVVTSLAAAPNKAIAFSAPMGTGTILALTALYFVITNNLSKKSLLHNLIYSLIISSALLGLVAVYQFLGLGGKVSSIPWLASKLFTPAGGPLVLISVLVIGLSLAIITFLKQFNRQGWLATILTGGASIIIAVGLILTIYQLLPGKETSLIMLSYPDSWAIGIEAFKRQPLTGIGPGNYLSAFNRFRPFTFNNRDFWDARFGNASIYPLELLTVGGLLVLGAYFLLLAKALRLWLKNYYQKDETLLPFLISLALMIIIPWFISNNLVILTFSFIFLAILASMNSQKETVHFSSKSFSLIVLGTGLALVIPSFYLWGRAYGADMAFRRSLDALIQNQGIRVYNEQIKALDLNPYNPNYRRAYSQTNFALANSLSSQENLSDQDRTNIIQLIQQAINEAKSATVLNPEDSANWENLAQIYRNLINLAEGADQWTIAAYQQAIATDPVNPRIRVNLGGLFYAFQNYEIATRHFENAVNLKPDYANGYYNLAVVYRDREMYQQAYSAMQTVLNLVPIDSSDYQIVREELDELAKKLPAPEEISQPEQKQEPVLTPPEPLPSPIVEPPIELPEESAPEIPPVEGEAEEESTPEPIPTPELTP
jgi:tetratricopeptide (TPR) repeat protein